MMEQYPTYKPSGVEWIGEIPEHWRISKFKYTLELYNGDSLNDEQKSLYESEDTSERPYISSKDIDVNYLTVNYNNGLRIPLSETKLKVGKKGGFLLCIEGGSSGRKMVFLEQDVCFVNKLCYFKSKYENSKFIFYFVRGVDFQSKFKLSLSGLIGGVSVSTLKNFEIPLPPLSEQEQIVQYLDEKTEEIDRLVSLTEKKIELLKEKRTSLINHVVTKGLDTNVKLKPSGVEWIGDIPEHWEVCKYKHISEVVTGNTPSKTSGEEYYTETENGYLWVKPSNLFGVGYVNESEERLTDLGKSQTRVIPKDSVMICCIGNTIGKYGMSSEELSTNQQINSVIPNQGVRPWFCLFYTDVFTKDLLKWSNFVTLPIYTKSDLEDTPFIKPPLDEQIKIENFLLEYIEKEEQLISIEEKRIDTLKEYRQSLISEVVTGKIKVSINNN